MVSSDQSAELGLGAESGETRTVARAPAKLSRNELDRQWDEVTSQFNWEKVALVMSFMRWTWHDTKPHSPTVDQLKSLAQRLYDGLVDDCGGWATTGGLLVRVSANDVRLLFVAESADVHKEDGHWL